MKMKRSGESTPDKSAVKALKVSDEETAAAPDDNAESEEDPQPKNKSLKSPKYAATSADWKDLIADTPQPPYYAVVFTNMRNTDNEAANQDYAKTAQRMVELGSQEPGFLGIESVRDGLGITVSYWADTESIKRWKQNCEHLVAQEKGQKQWYAAYKTRICKVERDYGFFS